MADVGAAAEFEEGKPKLATIDGRDIGVIRWRGEYFAVRNRCPHMLARICEGGVVAPNLVAGDAVGAIAANEETPVLGCPWHGWQFDLRTGQSVWNANYRVAVFRTECRDGRVFVDVHNNPAGAKAADVIPA